MIGLTSAVLALTVTQTLDSGFIGPDGQALLLPDSGIIEYFPDGGVPPGSVPWLHLSGNKVLPDDVYYRVLALSDQEAGPDADSPGRIELALFDFLHQSGYELATVRATATDGGVDVAIDEGRLEKVVFRGRLTAQTLRFRLELFIDQEIFNRPALERQIARLEKEVGVRVVKWALVPTPNPLHVGPQLDNMMPAIEGIELLHSRDPYELHLFFEEHDWGTGFGLDLRSGYIDGLEVGANYQGADVLLKGERIRFAASIGGGIHRGVISQNYYPSFTRAFGELQWFAPKIFNNRVRPYLWFTGQVVDRQRPDLGLEKYNEVSAIGSAHVAVDFTPRLNVTFGLGFQYRQIFNELRATLQFIQPPGAVPISMAVPSIPQKARAFVDAHGEWVLNDEADRLDRSHVIEAGARWYLGKNVADTSADVGYLQFGWVYERYRLVIPFGWHDLWIKSSARIAWGDVEFHDELSVGELLRGVFGDVFVRKGGNASTEFRFSLSRDVLKLSVFTEVAAWGEINRNTNAELFRMGVAAGPGFHALIQGMFQLDIYVPLGLMSTGRFSYGVVVFLNKVF